MKSHIKAYGIVPYLVTKDDIKILLCKSIASKEKWGCLKGLKEKDENAYECAQRELFEESSIKVEIGLFEDYFEQINLEKDIGIWLVNASNIENINEMFFDDKLKNNFLSWENSKVKFFSIYDLPNIRKKQMTLIKEIKSFLKNKKLHP
ncbi:NUDIX hydrolase [Poseidonibacter parvus]|uniref:NUDIX hydrolase n=1 Tax=Poseidonibacter parvus TaxID=1850254 RepID=A0A1P8KKM5_9BACT|nr:NUDIX domain-containing protein [Poseidonibacter parvus]APW65100.1 NUDIX hydrolase [Poseidonibacter parvus]